MTITPMQPADLKAVHTLLHAARLPTEGLDWHVETALVARDGDAVVGCAALELYPPYALLRSVAVDKSRRGRGLGQLLTAEAIALGRRLGVSGIFLLTETAAGFFPRLGFVPIAREQVPVEVQQSMEFTSLCPVSARAMVFLPGFRQDDGARETGDFV
jgi:amino-acid N-acetyltransferase